MFPVRALQPERLNILPRQREINSGPEVSIIQHTMALFREPPDARGWGAGEDVPSLDILSVREMQEMLSRRPLLTRHCRAPPPGATPPGRIR
jgi:hypothetical protein